MPITKQVELINKKEFIEVALDKESNTFVIHIANPKTLLSGMTIHPLQEAWIAALKQNEISTKFLTKYLDFSNVFSETEALVLPEQTNLNKHVIKLKADK